MKKPNQLMRNTSVKLVSLFALPCSGLRKCKYPAEKRNKTNSREIDVTRESDYKRTIKTR